MNNQVTAAGLRAAADAVDKLSAQGVNVIGYRADARKPVLLINTPPAFAHGVVKSRFWRSRTGARYLTRVYATPFHGCQIEWTQSDLVAQEVGHG